MDEKVINYLTSLSSLLATSVATDPVRDSLTRDAGHESRWVVIWGVIVALGCVAELPETWGAFVKWTSAIRNLELDPDDEKSWHRPLAAVGLLFVIVGIVGETICEGLVTVAETSIQGIDESKLGDAEIKAGEANERAAKAQLATDAERYARLREEESVSWRRLDSTQRSVLASALRRLSVRRTWLTYNTNDVESLSFASDLTLALDSSGWHPTEPEPILKMIEGPVPPGTNRIPRGVIVSKMGGKAESDAADVLVKELKALGYDATRSLTSVIHEQNPTTPTVFVDVEPRPEGPQGEAKLRETKKK